MPKLVLVSADMALLRSLAARVQGENGEQFAWRLSEATEEAVLRHEPDVTLLDVQALGDHEVKRRLTAVICAHDIPVVWVGAYADAEEVAGDLALGANDVLDVHMAPAEFSARLAAQIRLKGRLDQLKAEAVVDELTGVYNRRFMENQLISKLGEAWRYHHPFTFMILDIDHFKRVNDTYGHPFGDAVLRDMGELIGGMVRKEDTVTRYGGEEFALLLPHTDHAGAVVLGERMRAAIEAHTCQHDGKSASVTISGGAATYPVDAAESVKELVGCADQRLYRAKAAGRNQVVVD